MNILRKIGQFFINIYIGLKDRLRPRKTFRWIFISVLWLIVIIYLGFGIFFAIKVYKSHSENKTTELSVKIYPFPVAIVNNGVVWAKDYYQQLAYIRQFSSKTKQPVPDATTLRKQIIDQLIENKILEMQALRYNITVSNKDVNDAYEKIVTQSGGTSEVNKVLSELYGMSEKDFKNLVRQQVLKEKIQNDLIVQVKVAHILIKDEARANEIATRAKAGEDFASLAKQFSEDTKSRDAGGELGWLARGQLVVDNNAIPEFDEAAFKAKAGEIVGPVKTSIGFEIIKVEDRKGKIDENFNLWLSELEKNTKTWRLIK